MRTFKISVSNPTVPEAKKLTKDDVWGKWDEVTHELISRGMVIARGIPPCDEYFTFRDHQKAVANYPNVCPVWKDRLSYKSVTVTCKLAEEQEVIYWLEYVHGANSVSRRWLLEGGRVALRSDYQCW